MKKILLSLLLFLLLAALLAACGGAAPATEQAPEVDLASLPVNLTVQQVNAIRDDPDVVIIDVREQWEYDAGHIPNVKLIPLGELPNRLDEIPKDKFVVMACRSGNRSNQAAQFLRSKGFDNAHNMQGGIIDWQRAGFPVEK